MSAAAFEQFGTKIEQPDAGAEAVWRLLHAAGVPPVAANEDSRPFPQAPKRGPRLDQRLFSRLLAVADWLVLFALAEAAALWGQGRPLEQLAASEAVAIVSAAFCLKIGLWLSGAYEAPARKISLEHGAGGLALGAIAALLVSGAIAPNARGAAALAALVPLAAIVLAGVHAAFALWMRAAWKRYAFAETAIVVGATPAAARFIARAKAARDLDIVAIVDDRAARTPSALHGVPVAGGVDQLLGWSDLPRIDRIVIAIGCAADARVRALAEQLSVAPNRVDLLFDYQVAPAGAQRIEQRGGAPLAALSGRPVCATRCFGKRMQDLLFGGALIVLFAPVMLVIAALVKLDSPGPVLFKQRRHGLNNRIIKVWKFRTMRREACEGPTVQVCEKDPRVTRLGAFLRRTSLDELPQLFNVLRGDMSLVGPRPHAIDMHTAGRALTDIVPHYAHRHRVKPGITGWAQVHGSRGPVESPDALRKRVALDIDYADRASLWLDLSVMARTAPALLGDRKATR